MLRYGKKGGRYVAAADPQNADEAQNAAHKKDWNGQNKVLLDVLAPKKTVIPAAIQLQD